MMFTNPHRTRRRLAVAGALVLAAGPLAACGSDDDSATDTGSETEDTAASEVTISGQWARAGTAGGNTAVYMELTGGDEDDALVGAAVAADVASDAQIHETMMDGTDSSEAEEEGEMDESGDMEDGHDGDGGSMMTMQEVESIDLPAGQTVALEPGGFHVMLLDLGSDLVVGDTVEVTLTFESGAEQKVTAEVREG